MQKLPVFLLNWLDFWNLYCHNLNCENLLLLVKKKVSITFYFLVYNIVYMSEVHLSL